MRRGLTRKYGHLSSASDACGVITEDALFCARRAVERAWAHKGGKLHLLALDAANAFDSISSDALLNALSRFGIPDQVVEIIQSTYTDWKFVVHDCGSESSPHRQGSGVCQGCPLSPFLFIAVMTVIMSDAHGRLSDENICNSKSFIRFVVRRRHAAYWIGCGRCGRVC